MPNNDKQNRNNLVNQFEYTASIVSSRTPVLFSTNRGICLRTNDDSCHCGNSSKSNYKMQFCDLERWQCSVRKVNSIGLIPEDDHIKYDNHGVNHKTTSVKFVSELAGSSSESNVSK